jgi:hypothetical protein
MGFMSGSHDSAQVIGSQSVEKLRFWGLAFPRSCLTCVLLEDARLDRRQVFRPALLAQFGDKVFLLQSGAAPQ